MSLLTNSNLPYSSELERVPYNATLFEKTDRPSLLQRQISELIAKLTRFALREKQQASAETVSLEVLTKSLQLSDTIIEIYMICTETILARVVAEALKASFSNQIKEIIVIKGLLSDKNRFESEGLPNLKTTLQSLIIAPCVFNLTGGYRSLMAYMTLWAAEKNIPVYMILSEEQAPQYEIIKINA